MEDIHEDDEKKKKQMTDCVVNDDCTVWLRSLKKESVQQLLDTPDGQEYDFDHRTSLVPLVVWQSLPRGPESKKSFVLKSN